MERYFDTATVNEVFQRMTERFGDKVAVWFDDDEVTYTSLRRDAYNIAVRLGDMGIGYGDRVAVLLPNCYEFIALYFGITLSGATVVPINNRVVEKELAGILTDAAPVALFLNAKIRNSDYGSIVRKLAPELPSLRYSIMDEPVDDDRFLLDSEFFGHLPDLDERIATFKNPDVGEGDVALLAYTSGTTSHPKGVMITHGGLVKTSYEGGRAWQLQYDTLPEDFVAFSIAPLYGAQGFCALLLYLTNGVPMRWLSTFNPNNAIKAISRGEVTLLHTQPTMWSLLLSSSLLDFCDFTGIKLTLVSGSLCSYNLATRIEEKTGSLLLNGYGLIEATGIALVTRPDDPPQIRLNTVGRPIAGVEVKIVDDKRVEVAPGEIGEVALRGYLMKGYWNQPEKTRAVIDDDGFLYTGDLGRFYEGTPNVQLVGRAKEMIIRGGFNVYPIDVEEELLGFSKVQDVAVVGKPHEVLGEAIVAFIVPRPGSVLTVGEVLAHCRTVLSSNKMPDEVHFLRELPIIENGKVRKTELQQWAVSGVPDEKVFRF
jgi:fatty-acyl-CoA synthase